MLVTALPTLILTSVISSSMGSTVVAWNSVVDASRGCQAIET